MRGATRVALWTLLPVLIFGFRLREALFGAGSLFRGYDGAIQSYPWLVKVLTSWSHFEPPLWDFATFSGNSFIGELQTGALYPISVIWAWFAPSQGRSLEALVVLHYILAFCFMALLARKLGFSNPASFLAALSFSFYLDWAQPNRMFGMVFLPLILFCHLKSLERRGVAGNPWVLFGGAAWACSLLAGHHQPFIHSGLCLVLFALIVTVRSGSWGKNLMVVAVTAATALLLSAPQLLLTWEYLGDAYRWIPQRVPAFSQVSFRQYAFENTIDPRLLAYLIHSWMPVAALVAAGALWLDRCRQRRRLTVFALLLAGFSLAASLGHATPLGRLTWYLPGINLVRETERFIFPYLFAVSLLLAIATEVLVGVCRRPPSKALPWSQSTAFRRIAEGCVFVAAGGWLWAHSSVFLYVQPADDPFARELLYPVQPALEGTTDAAAIRFLINRSQEEGRRCRVINFGDALPPNFGDVYPILSVSGHRATMPAPYFDFLDGHWGDPKSKRFDQLGACYVVSRRPFDLPVVFQRGDLLVYQRPGAASVFRLVDSVAGETRPAKLREIRWRQNAVSVKLETADPGELLFAQLPYPGWTATIDGVSRPLGERNGFMTVKLEPGSPTVVFAYRPPRLFWGALIALIPFLATLFPMALRGGGQSTPHSTRLGSHD